MSRVRVVLLVLAFAACGGDDGTGVGPQTNTCTGTCLVVSNQSPTGKAVNEVRFAECSNPDFGADRLAGGEELRPNGSRGWPVTAGCWDIIAARDESTQRWQVGSFGLTLAAGETYTLVFDF